MNLRNYHQRNIWRTFSWNFQLTFSHVSERYIAYTALSVNIIALDVFVHTACVIRPAGSNEDESCSLSSAEIIYYIYYVLRCENYPQRTEERYT
jgi:hypothetical protein